MGTVCAPPARSRTMQQWNAAQPRSQTQRATHSVTRSAGGLPAGGRGAKPGQQFSGCVDQQLRVHPDRDKQGAGRQPLVRLGLAGDQNARGLAGAQDAPDAVVERGLHARVLGVGRMAHRGRQVRRADEHAIDSRRGGNGVEVAQGLHGFGLHQQAYLLVGLVHIVRIGLPARGARHGAAHAAHARRGVARGAHQGLRLLGRVHHRHQQRLHADVQVLLDQRLLADRHAGDRMGRRRAGGQGTGGAGDSLQLVQYRAQVVGRRPAVDQQPVVACARKKLGAVSVGQSEPQADLCLALRDGLLEKVGGCVHVVAFRIEGAGPAMVRGCGSCACCGRYSSQPAPSFPMAKEKTIFTCTECGGASPRWLGKCPACGAWNTLIEALAETGPGTHRYSASRYAGLAQAQGVMPLSAIEASDVQRSPSGIGELDRVLGGGIGEGGVVLIGGDPGIGKSTLLLQALDALQRAGLPTLYVTGEESGAQVALRSRRLGLEHSQVNVLAEIQLEKILAAIDAMQPAVAVIDSIQTMYSEQLTSAPGSVAQVRECAAHLTRAAKASGVAIVLVGHVTKEGALAGPRVLEHMVDTVLYFEGDNHSQFRLVRAIKNRFGAVNEIGVFAMTEKGLRGVSNPSAIFLSQYSEPVPGSCVMVTLEGSRPLLVEIQALVDSGGPSPRRLSVGLDKDRLAMLLAVLHRHAGVACMDQDVFVNAVGGVRISEPAADLAVMLSITSSLRGKALPRGFLAFGEVGLAGEVRPAPRGQDRLKEAAKLGFSVAVVPKANLPRKNDKAFEGLTVHGVDRIEEAMELARSLA